MTDRELMQQVLKAMETVGADHICGASHHAKKDQHKLDEPCPLQQRWHIAYQALSERLAQERKPVAWRKNYQNSGYTYFDERWGTIPNDAEPLFSN